MKKAVITIEGQENVNLIYSSMILGMIDLIENGKISFDDANMTLFLPLALRETHFSDGMKRAIGLCTELEAVSEVVPKSYGETVQEIRELCRKEVETYVRIGEIRYTVIE